MRKKIYTNEFLLNEAKKYSSSSEWYKKSKKTYEIAVKRKIIDLCKQNFKIKENIRLEEEDLFLDPVKESLKYKRYLCD